MTRLARIAVAVAAAALALPTGASAATVSAAGGAVTFTAASGESNRLSVSVANGALRFEDTGVSSLTAGAGCALSGNQRVDCAPDGVSGVTVELGDGNDAVTSQVLLPFRVYGGMGDDRITLFAGDDAVDGGTGADTIDTGWGDDTIDGGEGPDAMSGGYGDDAVVYASRGSAVSVTLDDAADDGALGEGDNVRPSVDGIVGGAGPDRLAGDSGSNTIAGGAGDDVIAGAGGDDALDGGAGFDSLSGGAGADSLRARDGAAEPLACGTEADSVDADHDDAAELDCEDVRRAEAPPLALEPPTLVLPPAPTGGTGSVIEPPVAAISAAALSVSDAGATTVRLKCPRTAFEGCAGSIVIETLGVAGSRSRLDVTAGARRPGRLASGRFRVAAGDGATIPIRLDRRGWRRLRARPHAKVQITVTMENATGTTTNTRTVAVRRAG